ncbi:MAG: endolytic transglycosylase MltG [Chlorobiaceae bacterium]|nr:endolytic transglycosylase MltG [Chlorobiaceae bacterium]
MKRTLRIVIFIGIVGISLFAYGVLWAPNNFEGDKILIVSKGQTFGEVADSLKNTGIIRSVFLFKIAGKLTASTTKLQIGKYRFKGGASNSEIIDNIQNGRTAETITVLIREGLRATTQAQIFSQKLGIDSSRFMELMEDKSFAKSLRVDAHNLTGYLMPKTYKFYWQTGEEEIIRTLVAEFWNEFDSSMIRQMNRRKMTMNEVLTMASIIELETRIDTERAIVAGVYYNRLQRRMRLQADPTVQFAIGGTPRRLHYSDLDYDSPYNTYKNYGLPPGPINNPGKTSILAALYPLRHKYLYFVATGEGGHRFTTSFSEHQKAIKDYRRVRQERKAAQEID